MYSLVQTAKINNLNIAKYINYLLEEIPQLENPKDDIELEKFLPWSENLPSEIFQLENDEIVTDLKI